MISPQLSYIYHVYDVIWLEIPLKRCPQVFRWIDYILIEKWPFLVSKFLDPVMTLWLDLFRWLDLFPGLDWPGPPSSPKTQMSRKPKYGKIKQRRGDFSINMCSIRPIIWGRYYEVRIHSTKEFRVQGLSPHYNIRPTMKLLVMPMRWKKTMH